MNNDLHAPLGQKRPEPKKRSGLLTPVRLLAAVAVVAVVGLSIYAARMPSALRKDDPSAAATAQTTPEPTENSAPSDAPSGEAGLARSSPQSGANVRETTTADGNVVTTFSPRPRDGEGPVMINTGPRRQEARLAGMGDDDFLETTAFGRLPVVAADGTMPRDYYSRTWSGARATRVAIVIGGLGLSQTGTQKAVKTLPPEVTLAFAASGNSLSRWVREGRLTGHEVLLQIPMEPIDYPANNPGPDTLLVSRPAATNLEFLHKSMGRMDSYVGVMGYMGGRFLSEAKAFEPILRDIGKRGLMFLDDGSTARSVTGKLAKTLGVSHAFGDLQIDQRVDTQEILKKLDELERIARSNGTAIGVGFAFDETIEAVTKWAKEAETRGIEIVGVASLTTP